MLGGSGTDKVDYGANVMKLSSFPYTVSCRNYAYLPRAKSAGKGGIHTFCRILKLLSRPES